MLQNLPQLNASKVVSVAANLLREIPKDLYDTLAKHTYDEETCNMILSQSETSKK
jgi:hypothetical protein